jgi:hypothetical protein
MPSPAPKAANLRQRRNKSASRAELPPEMSPIVGQPSLPANPLGDWHDLTEQWWADVWTSPQSNEFLRADLGALFRLAILVDLFWKSGKLPVAKEIRVLEREFGLTPLARRRLEWQVATSAEAADRHAQRQSKRATILEDPRLVLNQ